MANSNAVLIESLRQSGVLHSPRIVAAFERVDRAWFVPRAHQHFAYLDEPLPIGQGQTISQPTTVAIMLEAVQPQPGDNVLDVGAGSGWVAALLGQMVGPSGHVTAIELLPALADRAWAAIKRAGLKQVDYRVGDAHAGWPAGQPYNVIHVAAAALLLPKELQTQLTIGGRLVIPIGQPIQDLVVVTRTSKTLYTKRHMPGFRFVPLVSPS